MNSNSRRPALHLNRTHPERFDASADPALAAAEQTRAAFGLQFFFAGDPLAAVNPDSVTDADLGDLSFLFPTDEDLAVLRSVKPDYVLPPLEERTRRFLSDYLLCASLLEYEERSRRMYAAAGFADDKPLGNVSYWRSRCRAVLSLINSMPPGREKSLLVLRYINGHAVEQCADLLGISRRTAYRVHKRAITIASRILLRKRER